MKRIKDLLPRSLGTGPPEDDSSREAKLQDEESGAERPPEEDHDKALDALFDELGASTGNGMESAPGTNEVPSPPDRTPGAPTAPPDFKDNPAGETVGTPAAGRTERTAQAPVYGEILASLRQSAQRVEMSLQAIRQRMERIEGRQESTERNVAELLGRFRAMSGGSRSRSGPSLAPGPAGHVPGGLPEHLLESDHRERPTGGVVRPPGFEQAMAGGHEIAGEVAGYRGMESRATRTGPLLDRLPNDYTTVILLMRWIEFLLERVKRNSLGTLLDYYRDIGWISAEVKTNVMAYARGEVQDVTAYEPELDDSLASFALDDNEEPVLDDRGTPANPHYRPMDDWKLSAEDHLKSMLFIRKMAGNRIDRDELNALEQDIKVMKYSLRRYHEV